MTGTGRDITTRADIERLVDTFYGQVRADEILAPIFADVAHTDWARHLPKMYDFWETVLFGAPAQRDLESSNLARTAGPSSSRVYRS